MELRLPTPQELQRAYETDMVAAFPAAELKPLANIQRLWDEGRYQPWCLFDGDEIVGECFLWLGRPGWALLDYLCVSASRRNDGLGAELLRQMLLRWPQGVILGEVEAPEHAPDPEMAKRRLGFYDRNHARTAGYDVEVFGVHYKTIYWSPEPVDDARLMEAQADIYRSSFTPEKFARYVRVPRPAGAEPGPQVPWQG